MLLIRKFTPICRDRRPRLSEKTKICYAEDKEITPTDYINNLSGFVYSVREI